MSKIRGWIAWPIAMLALGLIWLVDKIAGRDDEEWWDDEK